MSALLADGPAMYLGGSIMTFALPYAAFIVIATALFFMFRAKHHGPRLKYMSPEIVTSVETREPGPVPAPAARAAAAPATAVPEAVPAETEVAEAKAEGQVIDSETEGKEGTE
ncbi:MAG TPA: hypothetical protein VMA73_02355 [Streptosporangiaceae bacterium]|nr:hypothetical protein [Streptosporangiaceae bacterium]